MYSQRFYPIIIAEPQELSTLGAFASKLSFPDGPELKDGGSGFAYENIDISYVTPNGWS